MLLLLHDMRGRTAALGLKRRGERHLFLFAPIFSRFSRNSKAMVLTSSFSYVFALKIQSFTFNFDPILKALVRMTLFLIGEQSEEMNEMRRYSVRGRSYYRPITLLH